MKHRHKIVDALTGAMHTRAITTPEEPKIRPPSWWTGDDDATAASMAAMLQMKQR